MAGNVLRPALLPTQDCPLVACPPRVIDAVSREDLPSYQDLMLPTLRAVEKRGGSAQAREVTAEVLLEIGATDEQLAP